MDGKSENLTSSAGSETRRSGNQYLARSASCLHSGRPTARGLQGEVRRGEPCNLAEQAPPTAFVPSVGGALVCASRAFSVREAVAGIRRAFALSLQGSC